MDLYYYAHFTDVDADVQGVSMTRQNHRAAEWQSWGTNPRLLILAPAPSATRPAWNVCLWKRQTQTSTPTSSYNFHLPRVVVAEPLDYLNPDLKSLLLRDRPQTNNPGITRGLLEMQDLRPHPTSESEMHVNKLPE